MRIGSSQVPITRALPESAARSRRSRRPAGQAWLRRASASARLSAYGRAGDIVRFYELDPDVLALAKHQFSYLNSSAAAIEFVIGDARLSLERELLSRVHCRTSTCWRSMRFSSDSIPGAPDHARGDRAVYQHLKPDGVLAVHISNRFLDLKPVLANIAQATGLEGKAGHRYTRR